MPKPFLIAMAGQSNATAGQTQSVPYPAWSPDPDIKIWTPQGFTQYVPSVNSVGSGPLSPWLNQWPNAWGMEATLMANLRLANPTLPVYLYKRTAPGIGMGAATGDDWNPYHMDKEFGAMLAEMATLPPNLPIDMFLWVGNETDTYDQSSAQQSLHNMVLFFDIVRQRTNSPDMRVIMTKVFDVPGVKTWGPWTPTVQEMQKSYCTNWPNATLVVGQYSAVPIETGADCHYSAVGLMSMGHLVYDIYKSNIDR